MTETLARPSSSPVPPRRQVRERTRGPVHVGTVAALRAAAYGLLLVGLPVLLVWASDARAGAGAVDVVRVVGQLWLVAHGASLDVLDGRFALTPLALCALPLWLLARAGRTAGRALRVTSAREALRASAAIAVPYAVVAGALGLAAGTPQVRPAVVSSFLAPAVLALLGAGAGVLRGDRLWRLVWLRLPAALRSAAAPTAAATGVLAAGAALLVAGSLVAHGSRAADLAGATAPGPVGGAALLVLGLSLVPNAVVWGASWLSGAGFAVGSGTAVSPFAHELGPVPAFPLLGALPGSALPTWAAVLVLAVPLAAGAVAGRLVAGTAASTWRAVRAAGTAALCAGGAWTVLAWLSGGSAGAERLVVVGPSPWRTGLAVAAEVAVGAVAAVVVARRRAARA